MFCPFHFTILKLLSSFLGEKRLIVLNILSEAMVSIGEAVLVEKWFDSEGEVSKGRRISLCDHIPIPFL